MSKIKSNSAFSLIELSIVILIIGIIIAGVTQGSRLVAQFKLSTARTLTKSSPVSSISGIVGWWESTSEESFAGNDPEEVPDGGTDGVSIWYDINPQASQKNNATSDDPSTNPGYTSKVTTINALPTIRFNGSNFFHYDGTSLANSDYSVFIVEQRTANNIDNMIISASGTSMGANEALLVGYGSNTIFAWAQYANDGHIDIDGFSSVIPKIHSLIFNSRAASPKIYYLNGAVQVMDFTGADPAHRLDSYENATFANFQNGNYQGNVGEIIIFNRGLKREERQSIESYLSKKWGIKI